MYLIITGTSLPSVSRVVLRGPHSALVRHITAVCEQEQGGATGATQRPGPATTGPGDGDGDGDGDETSVVTGTGTGKEQWTGQGAVNWTVNWTV